MKVFFLTTLLIVMTSIKGMSQSSNYIEFSSNPANISDASYFTLGTTNQGTGANIRIIADTNNNQLPYQYRGVIRFEDFQSFSGQGNIIIDSAKLEYYVKMDPNRTTLPSNAMYVQRVTGNWDELSINGTNEPTVSTTDQKSTSSYGQTFEGWDHVNVTDHVQYFVDNPNEYYGWRFKLQTEIGKKHVFIRSSDFDSGTVAPKLKVWYHIQENEYVEFGTIPANVSDAFTHSRLDSTNFGSHPSLQAVSNTYSGTPQVFRPYVRFDDFPGTLPSNAIVDSAKLEFFVDMPVWWNISTDNSVYVQRVTSTWDEMTITWSNQPGVVTIDQKQSDSYPVNHEGLGDVDITSHIQYFLANPSEYHGWCFQLVTEQPSRLLYLRSSSVTPPKLKVWYQLPESNYVEFGKATLDPTCIIVDMPLSNNTNNNAGKALPGNLGVNNGAVGTTDQNGYQNFAYLLDGVNDYIELNSSNPIITGGPFTITINAKMDGLGGGVSNQAPLFVQRGNPTTAGRSLISCFAQNGNNQISFAIRDSLNANSSKIFYPSPTDSAWHSYGFVLDANDSMHIYVDGVKVQSGISTQNANSLGVNIDYVSLGRHQYGSPTITQAGWFHGSLSNFRVFNCAISDSEINLAHILKRTTISDVDYHDNPSNTSNRAFYYYVTPKIAVPNDPYKGLIRFDDFKEILGQQVIVDSAKLEYNLRWNTNQVNYGSSGLKIQRVIENWDEFTVTGSNKPAIDTTDQITTPYYPPNTSGYWDTIDVTDHVQYFFDNPSAYHGWHFQLIDEDSTRNVPIRSSDFHYGNDGFFPQLKVWYRASHTAYVQAKSGAQVNSNKTSIQKNSGSTAGAAVFANASVIGGTFSANVPGTFDGIIGLSAETDPNRIVNNTNFGLAISITEGGNIEAYYNAQTTILQTTPASAFDLEVNLEFGSIAIAINGGTPTTLTRVLNDQLTGQRIAMRTTDGTPTPTIKTSWPATGTTVQPGVTSMSASNTVGKISIPTLKPGQQVYWNSKFIQESDVASINDSIQAKAAALGVPLWTLGDTLSVAQFNAFKAQDSVRYVTNSDPVRYTILEGTDTIHDVTVEVPYEAVVLNTNEAGYSIEGDQISASSPSWLSPLYMVNQYDHNQLGAAIKPEFEITLDDATSNVMFGFDLLNTDRTLDATKPQYGMLVDNGNLYALMNSDTFDIGVQATAQASLAVSFNDEQDLLLKKDGFIVWQGAMLYAVEEAIPKVAIESGAISKPTFKNAVAKPRFTVDDPIQNCGLEVSSLNSSVSLDNYLICSHPFVPQPCGAVAAATYNWYDLDNNLVSSTSSYVPPGYGLYRLDVCATDYLGQNVCYVPVYIAVGYRVDWNVNDNTFRTPNYYSTRLYKPLNPTDIFVDGMAAASNKDAPADFWVSGELRLRDSYRDISETSTIGFRENGANNLLVEGASVANHYGAPILTLHSPQGNQQVYNLDPTGSFVLLHKGTTLSYHGANAGLIASVTTSASNMSSPQIKAEMSAFLGPNASPKNTAEFQNGHGPHLLNCHTNLPCENSIYYEIARSYDDGYYDTEGNHLFVRHDFVYADGTTLAYKVVADANNIDETANTSIAVITRDYGHNEIDLDASQLADGYYKLILFDEKEETHVIRFHNKY